MDLMKNVFRVTLVVVCITLVVCIGTAVGDGRDEKVYHGQLALALLPVSAVTLMLAGEAVPTDQMTESGGVYTYTVDFAAYLEKWKAENLPADTGGADTGDAAGGSAGDGGAAA